MTRTEYINLELGSSFTTFADARAGVLDFVKKLNAASGASLAALLADPWGSRSISAGGGSKSLSYKGASDVVTLNRERTKLVAKLMYAIGEGPRPGSPRIIGVRFDG